MIGGLLGATPGILCFVMGAYRVATAVGLLGAFVGAMLALPGVSAGRVFRFLAAWTIAKNIPGTSDRMFKSVASGKSPPTAEVGSGRLLLAWFLPPNVRHRRGWLVLVGLAVGLAAGICFGGHDLAAVRDGGSGFFLPLRNSQDSLVSQAAMVAIGCSIWGAGVTALCASGAYRRPVLFVTVIAGAFSGLVGWSVDMERGPGLVAFVVFFTTIVLGVSLLMVGIAGMVRLPD
jgi:hypothetical protein